MTKQQFALEPPGGDTLTTYDEQHLITYLRLLDAVAEDADWHEIVAIVFEVDPVIDAPRARRMFETHLARARWMCDSGYRHLLCKG